MRSNFILFITIFVFYFGFAQEKVKILMIGNSFTFYYNLPMAIEQFSKHKGLNWEVHQSTAGGASFKDHWNSEKGLNSIQKIKNNTYTHVVLQEYSSYPLTTIDTTQKYLNLMHKISSNKSRKYLYATWSYRNILKNNDLTSPSSKIIEDKLEKIKPSSDIHILPVGRAFDLFKSRYPYQTLFTSDNKHPNPIGSYLAACVIFSKISNQSSLGIPRRVFEKINNQKDIYYFIVEEEMAKKCQLISDEIVFNSN
jgi:hypothetical protein